MPLTEQEVSRGAVAYLNGDLLLNDPLIQKGDHGRIGLRPFVCLRVNGNDSVWMQLTGQYSEKRLLLDPWKSQGVAAWISEPQYLNDARKPFSGPSSSFIASSKDELTYHAGHANQRPRINEEGMLAIEREMAKYSRKR